MSPAAPPPLLPLPIDPVLPEMMARLREGDSLVVEAPPGAGKTTRVPRALLESGLCGDGEVLVLEPRRLAARLSARRVAEELGEPLGERVGYAVRFEEVGGPRTRLRFVTHGVLLRRLLGDVGAGRTPLGGVAAVVFDEFHERTLESDLALALLRRAQRTTRPGLKLVAMSATLDGEPLARWLGAARVTSEGRRFEVVVEHAATRDERPLEEQVASAVRRLASDGLDGDVLVFLPGAREIRRAEEALRPVAARADLWVLSLHGDQSPAEQDRAVRPSPDGRRKVILSTNVAETSVTIDGVVAVVDSGLARIAAHDPWSGLPTLRVSKVSRASLAQRAGRAGRTRPGRALRLFTRHDCDSRPEFELPEIRRQDLADTLLLLHGVGVDLRVEVGASSSSTGDQAARFEWFEAPPEPALQAAEVLLGRLGAVAGEPGRGTLTAVGRRLLRFPLHPRLGRLLVEAERRGVAGEGALAAAILGEGRRGAQGLPGGAESMSGPSDLTAMMERRPHPETVMRAQRALLGQCDRRTARPANALEVETALGACVLAGFPDRVARRRRAGEPEVLLAGGGTATLAPTSVVRDAAWMVVIEVEERREGSAAPRPTVRTASEIEVDWLLDFPDALREEDVVSWSARSGRIEATRRLYYDELLVDESTLGSPDPEAVAAALAVMVLGRGPRAHITSDEPEAVERFLSRLAFVAAARPDAGITVPDDAALAAAIRGLCLGCRRPDDLKDTSLIEALRAALPGSARDLIEKLAPERVTLPGGRAARVEYIPGQPPSVASRLQDFFGMAVGPRVGGVPLTLHLLAPNQRAVQVTSDLSGFWERHYPAIRRELMRRYPRHSWPEDPLHAEPPKPGRPR